MKTSTSLGVVRRPTVVDEADSYELVSVCKPNSALQDNACYTVIARGARLVHATEFDELVLTEVAPQIVVHSVIDRQMVRCEQVRKPQRAAFRRRQIVGVAITGSTLGM